MTRIAAALLCCIAFCATGCVGPQVRFSRAASQLIVGEEQIDAVRFSADFQASNFDPEQQLLFEVGVLDSSGRPVKSRTGKYQDATGRLMALRTVMAFESPWNFENVEVSIPSPELNAARDDGATQVEYRIVTPDGLVMATKRTPLPAEFVAAPSPPPVVAERPAREESETPPEEPAEEAAPEVAKNPPLEEAPPIAAARRGEPPQQRESARPRAEESAESNPPTARARSTRRDSDVIRESPPPAEETASVRGRDAGAPTREAAKSETAAPTKPPARAKREAPANPPERSPAEAGNRSPAPRRPVADSEVEPTAPAKPEQRRQERTPPQEDEPPPAETKAAESIVYSVKAGDSLRSISLDHYGDAQYWPMILRANPEVNPLRLKVGDELVLPPLEQPGEKPPATTPRTERPAPAAKSGPVYIVKEGDTLPYIARQLLGDSRRWREIYDLNRDQLETPSAIRTGQRLKLPAAPTERDEKP
ncbi:MAG: LysM peptidoglycan-binding domain-containing protein [Planctomycetes bacterium]|nr:LysM peptidoglycan-binding domain-containing protein [Planctomycetota bacterium]